MSTTAQSVFDRGIARSTANMADLFTGKDAEVLARLNYGQQRLFTRLAQENRYFYVAANTLASTGGSSARTADLATLTNPLVERLLLAKLPSGVELSQVDLQDLEAELAPRFYALGSQMVEVGSEWGVAGAVTLSLWYAYRPAELNLAGNLTQVITVPDRFAEYLELDFAIYVAEKDFGRAGADPSELPRLAADLEAVYADYLQSLDHFAGVQAQRFVLPVPTVGSKA